jgi:hypothetical protein
MSIRKEGLRVKRRSGYITKCLWLLRIDSK